MLELLHLSLMGKRGPKPKGKVKIEWSSDFAYAIGLIATDGCVSPSGRHIVFVSSETEQITNFMKALDISNPVSATRSTFTGKMVPRVQFSDVRFWEFLVSIGITPAKSKTIGKVQIPSAFFFDFLRGSHDGDGTFYSYWDPRWRSSFMYYLVFGSASKEHLLWIQDTLRGLAGVFGHITGKGRGRTIYQLKYAKAESFTIIKKMYYSRAVICLSRKRKKIEEALREDKLDKVARVL